MKKVTKLLLVTSSLLMGVTAVVGFNQNFISGNAEEEIIIPAAFTSSIYRYAKVIKDSPEHVDQALLSWLNTTDNLSGLTFFDNDPVEYTAEVNRQTKDSFYVLAYLQEYLVNANEGCKSPSDILRITLDHAAPIKDNLVSFIDAETASDYEIAYNECKEIYQSYYDLCVEVANNVFCIHNKPVESVISNAKTFLENQISNLKEVGFDKSFNKYNYFFSALKGFSNIVQRAYASSQEHYKQVLDYVLFDENSPIDTYFTNDFLGFTQDDYDAAIQGISYDDFEQLERVSAPYLEKMERQLLANLMTFNFVTSYVKDIDSFKCMINNSGPMLYKINDLFEAVRDNDTVNIIILSFEIIEDYKILFGVLDLDSNQKDLKYEKFLANVRLGSLLYNNSDPERFIRFLDYVDQIDKVSLVGSTYEQGVEEINKLVLEGYKHINVDLISSSDQATLFFVNGLEALASREQGYSFELRRMLNHDHAFKIETKMQADYGNNLLYVNTIWLDMVLTDENTNHEMAYIANPIEVVFGIYNLQIGTDVRIYRYDEINQKAVALSNEETISGTDYFSLSQDDVSVHTKDFGTFAVCYINRLVKEEVENFRSNIADLNSQIAALNNQIAVKDATILGLQTRVTELEAEMTELEAQITSLQADIATKQNTINSLQNELNNTKATLNEKLVEIDNLNATVNSKNTLSIVFIVLACVFAFATLLFAVLYFLKKNKKQEQ